MAMSASCLYCGQPCRRKVCRRPECRRMYSADGAKERLDRNAAAGFVCHCGKPVQSVGLCRTHYKQQRRAEVGRQENGVDVACVVCGAQLRRKQTRSGRRPTCSIACRTELTWARCDLPADHPAMLRGARRRAALERLTRASTGTTGILFYACACHRCGAPFVDFQMSRYCSEKCIDADNADSYRARKRGALVSSVRRAAVFERDKWICKLCGKGIDRTATYPHPLSPSIDHIVPLNQGGTHEPANVQAAHFICNSRKGDRGGGEQLALIG